MAMTRGALADAWHPARFDDAVRARRIGAANRFGVGEIDGLFSPSLLPRSALLNIRFMKF